jgi:hypothetical protein
MKPARLFVPLLAALLVPAAASANYLGVLKLPRSMTPGPDAGVYAFSSTLPAPFVGGSAIDSAWEMKLGYRYSRFLSVEGQFNDFTRSPDAFATAATTGPAARGNGFGVDTVATLPWRSFSFYGKFGAYHGDVASPFSPYPTTLVGERGTRLRYGLGMRYNVTSSFGVEAQMERYAPLGGSSFLGEPEQDLFSVGVKWRF